MLLKINPENPEGRKIQQVVETLEKGGIIIYPTDTVYGLGCDISNNDAVTRICRIRGLEPDKAMLSFICKDISQISQYTMPIDNAVFRLMKKNLPGAFTFVLPSNNQVPKMFRNRKRTIGVRVPDHPIPLAIVETLGRPILTTSLKSDDEVLEYFTNPENIYEDFKKIVDIVIDSGVCGNNPSTIVDCTGDLPEIIRKGAGKLIP
ncbi:MAG: L-threonylcarbamoyladenylate synthase [Saprospiraceae bacterium]|nr:L-threonylcarbamoyladenylate synthase [Saprospiraceae bacterium]